MATYRVPALSLDENPIPPKTLAYYSTRFQREIWELVVGEFDRVAAEHGMTQAALANRLGADAGLINRQLASPGNRTLETISNLCVAMGTDPRGLITKLKTQLPRLRLVARPGPLPEGPVDLEQARLLLDRGTPQRRPPVSILPGRPETNEPDPTDYPRPRAANEA